MKTAALFPFLNEDEWLHLCMKAVEDFVEEFFIVVSRRIFYAGTKSPYELYLPYLNSLQPKFSKKVTLVLGDWVDAIPQGQDLFNRMHAEGYECVLTFDSDEVADPETIASVLRAIEGGAGNVGLPTITYFKNPWFVVEPNEQHILVIATRLTKETKSIRLGGTLNRIPCDRLTSEKPLVFMDLPMHHFSWIRSTEEKILQKTMGINGLSNEKKIHWYRNVWKTWKPWVLDFHPCHGPQYHTVCPLGFFDIPLAGRRYLYETSKKRIFQKGDTLWKIAKAEYGLGSYWSEVEAANPDIPEFAEGVSIAIPNIHL